MITNWGYEAEEIGTLLPWYDFDVMTAKKYHGDQRIEPMIRAAETAVRNYCGWHVGPPAVCTFQTRAHDPRLIYNGRDTIIQLPARYISEVASVKVGDAEISDYSFEASGLLRIYDLMIDSRKALVTVVYTAGLPCELAGAVKELIAHRVTHALAQSYGVQSEAAGGVSITYSTNWINSARATALPDDNKEVLNSYRLQGVY